MAIINKRKVGNKAEQLVAQYLKKQHIKVLCTNYNTHVGEIDIIAKDRDVLLFIEVKSRSDTKFGYGREAVTISKQRHIVRTAQHYLACNKITGVNMRFDVAEVQLNSGEISYFADAFRPQ